MRQSYLEDLRSEVDRQLREHVQGMSVEREVADRKRMYDEYVSAKERNPLSVAGLVSAMFTKRFGEQRYAYVALHVPATGRWYLTGGSSRTPQGVSWEDLALWLVSGEHPVPYGCLVWLEPVHAE